VLLVHPRAGSRKQCESQTQEPNRSLLGEDEGPLFEDYRPSTVRIHVDLSEPSAKDTIERICQREQDVMLLWLDEHDNDDKERLAPKFNGTIGSLCLVYEHDPASGFARPFLWHVER
jgi:hypothetical protein